MRKIDRQAWDTPKTASSNNPQSEYLVQQLGWKSVYAYNNEDFEPVSL